MKDSTISTLLVLILSLFFVACGGSSGGGEGGSGSGIYGLVTDYDTGESVANANVQLRPGGETTLTGSDGMFEFRGLPTGDYSITVSKAGYTDLIDDYVITVRDRMVRRDIQIKNTKCNDGYFFNGSECVNPCDANPCDSATCKSTSATTYECECSEGYWDGSKCDLPPCDKKITPCKDRDTGYIWSNRSKSDMNWDDAVAYCNNLTEWEFSDWGLPAKDVLVTLYDHDEEVNKLGDWGGFWSSTVGQEEDNAYYIEFDHEGGYNYDDRPKSQSYSVRCVRW